MQRLRSFIAEQREGLRMTAEITAEALEEVSKALNRRERARLWAYFAKWKCQRYRQLLHDISMETFMLEAQDAADIPKEADILF